MPDDLLRHLIDAPDATTGWIWSVVAIVAAVIAWYVALFWWTAPRRADRQPAIVTTARAALTRRRALRAITDARNRYRAGDLSASAAAAEVSRQVRLFLRDTTGEQVEYLQLPDIVGTLAPAAPVLTDLTDAQFNLGTVVDVDAVADAAEELVRRWT